MNNFLVITGIGMTLYAYSYTVQATKESPDNINFFAFVIPASIDGITTASIFLQKKYTLIYTVTAPNETWISGIYFFGSLYVGFLFWTHYKEIKIQKDDWVTFFLIIICMTIWFISKNNLVATIASVTAALTAGLLQLRKTSTRYCKKSLLAWKWFLAGSIAIFFAGDNDKLDLNSFIEQRLCAFASSIEFIILIYYAKKN